MRTLHADLTAAQVSVTATPYLEILFEKGQGGGTTYTYKTTDSPNRIRLIRHIEEPYNSYAVIVLDNSDLSLPDLFGYFTTISYGYNTASGDKKSDSAPLWVKRQIHTSKMGDLDRVLYLEGQWNLLAEMHDIGSLLSPSPEAPYYDIDYTGESYSIYDIINQVVTSASMTMTALGGEDDSIIDTLLPDFVVNEVPFENAAAVIFRLLNMTKVFCLAQAGGAGTMTIKYPSGYGSYDYTYTSDKPAVTDHQFREFEWKDKNKLPNIVYVLANQDAGGGWGNIITGGGEQYDNANNNEYPDITEYHLAATLVNQTDADNRAAAIALRRWMEGVLGKLVVPHNCGQELYDWIEIKDKRGAAAYTDYPTNRWGNTAVVGSLVHRYEPASGVYDLEITINGIAFSSPIDKTAPLLDAIEGQEEMEDRRRVIPRQVRAGGGPFPGGAGGGFQPMFPSLAQVGISGIAQTNPWNVMMSALTGSAQFRQSMMAQAFSYLTDLGYGGAGVAIVPTTVVQQRELWRQRQADVRAGGLPGGWGGMGFTINTAQLAANLAQYGTGAAPSLIPSPLLPLALPPPTIAPLSGLPTAGWLQQAGLISALLEAAGGITGMAGED